MGIRDKTSCLTCEKFSVCAHPNKSRSFVCDHYKRIEINEIVDTIFDSNARQLDSGTDYAAVMDSSEEDATSELQLRY